MNRQQLRPDQVILNRIDYVFKNTARKPKHFLVDSHPRISPEEGVVFVHIRHDLIMAIDSVDWNYLQDYCICKRGIGYAVVSKLIRDKHTGGSVHRIVAEQMFGADALYKDGKRMDVDHINGDPTDNRRSNLRLTNHHGNMRNQTKSSGSSKYKGVYKGQTPGTWKSGYSFKETGMKRSKSIHLGTFKCPREAALAYDAAITGRFGRFAKTNKDLGLL